MEHLSRRLIEDYQHDHISVGSKESFPVKVLQFGEGNFLRAYADYMIDELNSAGLFKGSIAVVQPIQSGLVDVLNQQDCLYTLLLRGLEDGHEVCVKKIITSISQAVNPYEDFESYMAQASNPALRFVVSNTTESGIVYNPTDQLEDKPQISFPAKVTAFLYRRFDFFHGDAGKGLVFIPCELIDNNGTTLKSIVLKLAEDWNLGEDFIAWVENANIFTNTLVDRIVTGYPRNEIDSLTEEFGYVDNLINTCEIFHFWVIEGPDHLKEELPFDKIGLNVVWTDDATPYKMRKVRILNGAHTCSVLAAYLSGKNTVGEILQDPIYKEYLRKTLFEEIIPTLDLPHDNLVSFANSVFDRFANPFIEHYLLNISLNSVSKYKTRVLPSILEYCKRKEALPEFLTFSLAALMRFYQGAETRENTLIGHRGTEEYKIMDDMNTLSYFKALWATYDGSKESISNITVEVCKNKKFWGVDLTELSGFSELVADDLYEIMTNGVDSVLSKIIK